MLCQGWGEAERFLPTLLPLPGMETTRALLVAMVVGELEHFALKSHLPLLGEPPEMFGSRQSGGWLSGRWLAA